MTASASINGRPQRKLLSEELDRLDSIIDSLAEGLPAAVAAACREGTRQAVKDAMIEIVSNPELRALLQVQVAAPAPAPVAPETEGPGLWSRIKARVATAKAAAARRARIAKAFAAEACKTLVAVVPVKKILLVAGIGFTAGIALHFAPAGLTAAIWAVTAVMAALVAKFGNWSRRTAKMLMATG